MQLQIRKPFLLEVKLVEIDEHLPSFKVELEFEMSNIRGRFLNAVSVWFHCKEWDQFQDQLAGLASFNLKEANLKDLEKDLKIKIWRSDEGMYFELSCFLREKRGGITSTINLAINEDELGVFKSSINAFDKWW